MNKKCIKPLIHLLDLIIMKKIINSQKIQCLCIKVFMKVQKQKLFRSLKVKIVKETNKIMVNLMLFY